MFNDPISVERDGILSLDHDQNYISFEFVALDFTAPERNRYRYMLEGNDRTWTESGGRRFASYTNLPSGAYVFRVRGSNADGTWSGKDASLNIRIASPFWEQVWFRGGILLLGAAALGMAYRANIRRLQKEHRLQSEFSRKLNESQEAERKRLAGELHDGLGQELLAIKGSIDHLAGQAPAAGDLKNVSDAVQQAIENVREISADLHPHMLERLGLSRTMRATIRRVADATGLDITASVDPLDNRFTPLEEINIFRILQEALNNIIRHSHASQCQVRVAITDSDMTMEVTDDGCGFDAENARSSGDGGLGLVNMAERVRMLDGDMEIESSPGNGTALRFRIPLKERPAASV
jgi:signal transduction histidine kinase